MWRVFINSFTESQSLDLNPTFHLQVYAFEAEAYTHNIYQRLMAGIDLPSFDLTC